MREILYAYTTTHGQTSNSLKYLANAKGSVCGKQRVDRSASKWQLTSQTVLYNVAHCAVWIPIRYPYKIPLFFFWRDSPQWARVSSFKRVLDHTQRRIAIGKTPWTSDQLVAETSTWQHTALTTDIHDPGGIRTHNLSRRAAADLRLGPRGHWAVFVHLKLTVA